MGNWRWILPCRSKLDSSNTGIRVIRQRTGEIVTIHRL